MLVFFNLCPCLTQLAADIVELKHQILLIVCFRHNLAIDEINSVKISSYSAIKYIQFCFFSVIFIELCMNQESVSLF